jgi:hypothetical protein
MTAIQSARNRILFGNTIWKPPPRLRARIRAGEFALCHPCGSDNAALLARDRTEQAKRERGIPTVPSTIALEKATNPFLRVLEPDIVESIRIHTGLAVRTQSESFEALGNWKDSS